MILRQFLHTGSGRHLLPVRLRRQSRRGSSRPVGDIQVYLRAAEETGMRIRFVIDTHIHADHPSAARRLAAACGAAYVLAATANVSFPFHPAHDGEVLSLGNVAATVLHTPGHTPEHLCLLVS